MASRVKSSDVTVAGGIVNEWSTVHLGSAEDRSRNETMTELRDKIAIEVMKSLIAGMKEGHIALEGRARIASASYKMADSMIAAREVEVEESEEVQKADSNVEYRWNVDLWRKFYESVASGKRTFDIRKNDRDFAIGDIVRFNECHDGAWLGRSCYARITYIFYGGKFGIADDRVIWGIELIPAEDIEE